jgi:competence protein ComEA
MKISKRLLLILLASAPLYAFAGPVDINSADAETISAELKGIGLSKAKAIVEYRGKHGPFKSPEDLTLVKGIGDATVARIKADVRVAPVNKK